MNNSIVKFYHLI